ncbi:hypothetical protein [Cupriavidus basilensis]|uniref:hypothetical protein n=1 Tax=Cupriavidus basilensis TaxID=68895 RepID=UPI0023E8AD7A|nr:hypothetical protein [Cupriavidus basilensis]MDF3884697.1 hypothetical protein [Cupriavidus basilensis]
MTTDQAFRQVRVCIDGCYEGWAVAAYWDGELWNGWVVPYFTMEGMRELAGHVDELEENKDGTFSWFDEDFNEAEPREVIAPQMSHVGQSYPVPLYVLPGWCFQLAD